VKEAISPSVAESIRSVFAAFVWHEGVVHDAMAIASYLKFHPALTKQGDLAGEIGEMADQAVAAEQKRKEKMAKQRHSVEVISASYLNQLPDSSDFEQAQASVIATAGISSTSGGGGNANTNRNMNRQDSSSLQDRSAAAARGGFVSAGSNTSLVGQQQQQPQPPQYLLPPTLKLFVMLWEEIRSYCVHAILQQFIVTSGQVPLSFARKIETVSGHKIRDRKSKRIKRSRTVGSAGSGSSSADKRMWAAAQAHLAELGPDDAAAAHQQLAEDELELYPGYMQGFLDRAGAAAGGGGGAAAAAAAAAAAVVAAAGGGSPAKLPSERDEFSQECEMCGNSYQVPVTFHMKKEHPGCGRPAWGMGYSSSGNYAHGWVGNCGDGGTETSTYYLICSKCRERYCLIYTGVKPWTPGLTASASGGAAAAAAAGAPSGGGAAAAAAGSGSNRQLSQLPLAPPTDASMNSRNQQHSSKAKMGSSKSRSGVAAEPVVGGAFASAGLMTPAQKIATSPTTGQPNSHMIMSNNAIFLLGLASSFNSQLAGGGGGMFKRQQQQQPMASSSSVMQTSNLSAVEELLPFDPNPFPLVPFQCFHALGVQDGHLRLINDQLVLDEALKCSDDMSTLVGTPSNATSANAAAAANIRESSGGGGTASRISADIHEREISPPEMFQTEATSPVLSSTSKPVFFRSASVSGGGAAAGSGGGEPSKKRNSTCCEPYIHPQHASGSEEAKDFLSKPSPALKKLFTSSDPNSQSNNLDSVVLNDILQRPVMSFVLQWNDLESLQLAMTMALRKAACRTFAMQAFNWLLRSVSQPACLHDLLWCFAAALENQQESEAMTSAGGGDDKAKKAAAEKANNIKKAGESQSGANGLFDHPASDLRIAGESIHPLPSTFHSLLQTISDLMLLLPVGSSLQQIAITCWGIKFKQSDHQFLHQSHVFSTISKILSRSEEAESPPNMHHHHQQQPVNPALSLQQHADFGHHHYQEVAAKVERLQDISQNLELKVSSRPAMIVSLMDNSTETFWESGEEDRNKSKWVTAALPSNLSGGISTIAVHIDNCRDLGNKVASLTFKGGKSADDLRVLKQADVESRFAGWLSCFASSLKFIKIELKGPDNTLRLRQVKALGTVGNQGEAGGGSSPPPYQSNLSPKSKFSEQSCSIQQLNCEAETLRVFRLITGQVFGRLLDQTEMAASAAASSIPPATATVAAIAAAGAVDDSDTLVTKEWEEQETNFKEHVVGILFSGSKLTHLQKQVCTHIVQAINKESSRMREEWEVGLLSSDNNHAAGGAQAMAAAAAAAAGLGAGPDQTSPPDTYCFEMLSLVLALSGSSLGRSHLATQYGLIQDLMTLLHTGTARIQRQVIALLRRVLPHVLPEKLAGLLGISSLPPKDFGILAAAYRSSSEGAEFLSFDMHKQGILDVFLSCIAKSLTLQVKVKGQQGQAGGGVASASAAAAKNPVSTVTLASSIQQQSGSSEASSSVGSRWWMRGTLPKKISEEIISLLKDMTEGKLSEEWSAITKSAIAENILNLTRLEGRHRDSSECLRQPVVWLALSSLCVLDHAHVDGLSSGEWSRTCGGGGGGGGGSNEAAAAPANPRPTCDNHDDAETLAIIMCDVCGNLCGDCDRFLHLHRKTRSHQRQVFKEEEEAIKVDLHEGCGRAKLFWIMALADSSTLKAMVEFRGDGGRSKLTGAMGAMGANSFLTCRFCGVQSNSDAPVINGVCSEKECAGYAKTACQITLPCGHYCGGIADETNCLPCLHGCQTGGEVGGGAAVGLRQDADDMCMICFTDALSPIPSILLECGHVFHYHCCAAVLEKRWLGPRITFGFRNCPICKAKIRHPSLKQLMDPIDGLFEDVKKKSLMRLEYEGLSKCEAIEAKGARFYNDPVAFALERYAYYVCFKCGKAYYGGEAQCDADAGLGDDYNPEELVCGGCSDVSRAQMCLKHGTDYLEYKCRYCCSVAVFFCFGNTHFCNACHDDFQRVANVPKSSLPQCPVGPKLRQLDGDECPLHVKHPPTGEEFALGCGICRNAHTF